MTRDHCTLVAWATGAILNPAVTESATRRLIGGWRETREQVECFVGFVSKEGDAELWPIPAPGKQRTRQHVIAAQCTNHVERFIIDEGHTAQRVEHDYGYDLILLTYDADGFIEPGSTCLQLKASETLKQSKTGYVFDLDIRDYNLWTREKLPVFLILFDASRRRAYWLYVQAYFQERPTRRPRRGAKTVRVRVPTRQVVNRRAIARMRTFKH